MLVVVAGDCLREEHPVRKTSIFLVLAFAVWLSPSETRAVGPKTCNVYADEATAPEVQEAMDKCGYRGDAWNPGNRLGHFNWCSQASLETVQAERERRRQAIGKCNKCRGYAADAVSAHQFNDPEGRIRGAADGHEWPPMPCGYSGDAWSDNVDGHLRWCMGASDADVKRESDNRKAFRDICWTCRQYAHKAVVSYYSVWDKCKNFWSDRSMSGEDWSVDHQHHFRWCMGINAARRKVNLDFAQGRRDKVAEACRLSKISAPLTVQPAATAETRRKVPPAAKQEAKRAATKPVAAARKSSDTDAVKSSPAKKPSAGSGSSAMDRLGGGPSGSVGGAGAGSAAKARGGGSSAAQPASAWTGGGGGVAPPATTINRNAIGGGGPQERIR
jgi:hypothetical protein